MTFFGNPSKIPDSCAYLVKGRLMHPQLRGPTPAYIRIPRGRALLLVLSRPSSSNAMMGLLYILRSLPIL